MPSQSQSPEPHDRDADPDQQKPSKKVSAASRFRRGESPPLAARTEAPPSLAYRRFPRTTTACNRCRKKRGRCDGQKPICSPCKAAGAVCEYELGGDKRKPYTKAVVQAMQLRIDTLESQLAALTGAPSASSSTPFPPAPDSTHTTPAMLTLNLAAANPGGGGGATPGGAGGGAQGENGVLVGPGPTSLSFAEGSAPQVNPNPQNLDTFQGGLAVNAHGELRFYGPTSSYRAVLADSTSLLNTPTTVNAIRAFSLTRAPIPTAAPADPALPRRPPDLTPDFKAKLFNLAFEYCFAHYNIVPERQFYADLQMFPFERTQNYSPFLMNVILAVGCRYLDPEDDWPAEICGLIGDPDTRGDVFVTWARYLLDQEWYNPALSTIRGLLVLGLYLAGRGFDGPCLVFVKNALTLAVDFGLNLGPHRLSMSMGLEISEETIAARRDCFWSAFCSDIIASLYIGRPPTFTPDMIDTIPPKITPEFDFEEPLYRSSAFHWSSRLVFIASKILTTVYSLKPGISLAARQAAVPELHLLLESWYHELPSHLRASGSDPSKAPHPHILVLQASYNMLHISLHRPFFRRHSSDPTTNVSTEKCLVAASNIVRLIKLLRGSAGLRKAAPGVQHAAFNAGTILAISAVEDGISDSAKLDLERRAQAKKDLKLIVASLKEIGATWTTAHTSAGVLEALTLQWEAMSSAPTQPGMTSYTNPDGTTTTSTSSAAAAPGSVFPSGSPTSPTSSTTTVSTSSTLGALPSGLSAPSQSHSLGVGAFDPHSPLHTAATLPKLEEPSYTPGGSGSATPSQHLGGVGGVGAGGMLNGFGLSGMGFSRPGTSGGGGGLGDVPPFGFGYMFPSFSFGGEDDGVEAMQHDGADGDGGLDLLGLLNMPESATQSQAPTPAQQN
ncbi:hypothetical protein JCM10207_004000 [Rhodosporidiobolus poonsookiae]